MVRSMSDVLDIGFSHTLRDKISRARQNCHWFTIRSFSFPDSIFHLISTDGAKIVKFDRQTDTPGVNCSDYWPGMFSHCKKLCRQCPGCAQLTRRSTYSTLTAIRLALKRVSKGVPATSLLLMV